MVLFVCLIGLLCIPLTIQPATCSRTVGQCGLKPARSCCKAPCARTCHTIYLPRSPHANDAYFMSFARHQPLSLLATEVEGGFAYAHSFQDADIATCLVRAQTLLFAGSNAAQRTDPDLENEVLLLADQFGLSPQFAGSATLHPTISNQSVHLQGIWYQHHFPDEPFKGVFVRGRATVTRQSRSLFAPGCSSFVTQTQGGLFPPGAVSADSTQPLATVEEALSGTRTFGAMQSPWCAGRFTPRHMSATNLSGATIDLGYAMQHHDVHAFSCFIRYRPPVGTHINGSQPYATSLFYPIIGDGKHNQIGAGASMSGELWSDGCGHAAVIHCEGYVTHLLGNRQLRSFDLLGNGCLSRYELLKVFDRETVSPQNELVPTINITTQQARVSVPALGEVTVQLIFSSCRYAITVGYEFYGQTAEKVSLPFNPYLGNGQNVYGLKGCEGLYYFSYLTNPDNTINSPATPFAVLSNAVEASAPIDSCAPVSNAVSSQTATTVGIAWNSAYSTAQVSADVVPPLTPIDDLAVAFLSSPPSIITQQNIDICSGSAPTQVSHKGTLAWTYWWNRCRGDHEHAPFFAVAVEAEGSGKVCSLKQVGFWIKAGCTF